MYQPPRLPPGGTVVRIGSEASFEAYAFCDGTVKKRHAAYAYVLLDAEGKERVTCWQSLDEPTRDSTTAEFAGVVAAVGDAVSRGITRLWVGTDSYQLVEHARKRSSGYQRFVDALQHLGRHLDSLTIQCIERCDNKRADALARRGIAHLR